MQLGNLDITINVNRAEGVDGLFTGPLTVEVEHHSVTEHPEVQLVPSGVHSGLSLLELERLECSVEGDDGELHIPGPGVEGDGELRLVPQVVDADQVPGHLRAAPGLVRADERELLRQPQREDVPGGNLEVGVSLEPVGRLHAVRTPDTPHAGVTLLQDIQAELADEVKGL